MTAQKHLKTEPSRPEGSRQIENFRHSLALNQVEFAKRLGAAPMSVSRWERGILKVPANIYIKLGNLAGDPLCWYFWGQAGLHSEDVMRVLPAARDRLHQPRVSDVLVVHAGHKKPPVKPSDFVAIPLLPVQAGTVPGETGEKEPDLGQV